MFMHKAYWDVLVLKGVEQINPDKEEGGMKIIAVHTYVDNFILVAKTLDEAQQMKESLSETFNP